MTQNNQTNWKIDAGHSEIQFKVKHLAISNVAGTFKKFKGAVLSHDDEFDNADVTCVIDVASLDTNNTQRDEHLRSNLFFDAPSFPEIVFSGHLIRRDDVHELTGELTIRGVIRKVVLEVQHTGIGKGRFNDTRAGFEIKGKITRKDFGLAWDVLTDAGGFVIGDTINLHFDIELIRE